MANKLSWNPPKWKSYSFDGYEFKVELETREVYTGTLDTNFISMLPDHHDKCLKIFGKTFGKDNSYTLNELSKVLDLNLKPGNWPESDDVPEFLKRYYERVSKIEKSFTQSIISIESEAITPKFTL